MKAPPKWFKFLALAVFAGGMFLLGIDLARFVPRFGEPDVWGFAVHALVAGVFGWVVLRYLSTAAEVIW